MVKINQQNGSNHFYLRSTYVVL